MALMNRWLAGGDAYWILQENINVNLQQLYMKPKKNDIILITSEMPTCNPDRAYVIPDV